MATGLPVTWLYEASDAEIATVLDILEEARGAAER